MDKDATWRFIGSEARRIEALANDIRQAAQAGDIETFRSALATMHDDIRQLDVLFASLGVTRTEPQIPAVGGHASDHPLDAA